MDSTFKPALILMSGRALGFALTFFIPVVLVRIFEPAEFGTYKQIFLIYATLYSIAQLGMAESLYYFLPLAQKAGGRFVLNAGLALATAGLLCLGILTEAGSMIASWMGNSRLATLLPYLGVFLLLMLPSAALEITMTVRQRYPWASWSYALSDLARAAFCLLPVLVLPKLEVLLLGAITFALLRVGAAWWYLRYEFDGGLKPDHALFKRQLTYTLPYATYVLIHIVQENFHQYAVSYHVDAATFAIYVVGCLQIPLVDLVASSVANVMMVRMSERIRDGHGDAVAILWHDTTRKQALIFFPLVGMLLLNARELIVVLFTQNYLASVPIFMVGSLAILLAVFPTDGVLRIYAQTRFLVWVNLIKLLVIVVFIHWFLITLHLAGAILITLLATAIGKGLGLLRMKKLMEVGLTDLLPWRSLAAIFSTACLAGLPALMLKSELGIAPLPALLITGFVYTASYLTLSMHFGLLREAERFALAGWLKIFRRGNFPPFSIHHLRLWAGNFRESKMVNRK